MKQYVEKEHDYNIKKLLKKQAKKEAKIQKKKSTFSKEPVTPVINPLDKELMSEISEKNFWEDMTGLIQKGANPTTKDDKGDDIQVGLIRIMDAWADMAFKGNFKWNDSEGKMRIAYLKEQADIMIYWGVDINYSPDNSDAHLSQGNFFYKLVEHSMRYPELASLAVHLFEKGAKLDVEFKSAYRGTLEHSLGRRKHILKTTEDGVGPSILISLHERRKISEALNEQTLESEVKNIKRL